MTQKELSYVEDAIGHEVNIISICNETVKMLTDSELINFIQDEITKHTSNKQKLMNILEACANE